jgi:3-oxoadipate enol-lactonase
MAMDGTMPPKLVELRRSTVADVAAAPVIPGTVATRRAQVRCITMEMAPPLVLLHPFPLDSGFWTPLRRLLPHDWHVLAPDFPGMGAGAATPADWSVDGVADAIAGLIRGTASGRAVVCGLSLGGYVALSVAARHPEVVAGLVLANTRAEADDAAGRAARNTGIARVLGGDRAGYLDALLPRLVAPGTDTERKAAIREIADRQSPEGIAAALRALRDRPSRTDELERIHAPALVIWGGADQVTPEAAARGLAERLPAGRFHLIDNAGHLSAWEQPELFAAAIAEGQAWR